MQIETLDVEEYYFQQVVNEAAVRRIPVEKLLEHMDDLRGNKEKNFMGYPWLLVHNKTGSHIGYKTQAQAEREFAKLPHAFWSFIYRPQLDI